jgi:L-alanine-DL-glutamate epimerase-like enolase superfamily enzyme
MLVNPLVPSGGSVAAPDLPGFGMEIRPEVWEHPAAVRRTTKIGS